MLDKIKALSDIERKLLLVLSEKEVMLEFAANNASLPIDSVRRASAWLSEKELAHVSESSKEKWVLTSSGEIALTKGMPENIFLETLTKLGGKAAFSDLQKESGLSQQEFTAALGINKRKAFIVIIQGKIEETGVANEQESFSEQNYLRDIVDQKQVKDDIILDLQKRGLVEKKLVTERKIKVTSDGVEAQKVLSQGNISRVFDVSAPVPTLFAGKKSPYNQFLKQIRGKLVALGFEEIEAPLVVTEFYNFDVLFQPQNHPARNITDSYQLKRPAKGTLPDKKTVDAVRAAHETGGKSKSKGWRYSWSEDIASRAVPAMHGTAHSARKLVEGVTLPHKYFAVARCFRPDVLDATHLIEFNQMEGFIVGEDLNFKHLLGMLKDFAIEFAGAEKVKFIPDYYPFTEPSVQLSAKHPEMGWIEFAGAGMFRPEMLENLGVKGQAIAWGVGIDRLAMFKLGIKDIRYLFAEDISYLRNAKGVFVK